MKYLGVGKFVGTETGGTYTCNDNSGSFSLRNTGLTVRMARNTFAVKVTGIKRFEGIKPDILATATSRDVMGNTDTILDRALAMTAKKD